MNTENHCGTCGKVGVTRINNQIEKLQLFSKKRKKKQIQFGNQQQQTFDLGNGVTVSDPVEAVGFFLQRDFHQILECETKPHQVIFSPSSFLYGPVTKKAVTKIQGRETLSPEKIEELKKYNPTLEGAQVEEKVYNKLRHTFEQCGETNVVVINGWKDNGGKEREMREYDFLLVLGNYKTIIHIEVKTTKTKNSLESAANQLKNGEEFFRDSIPFPEHEDWKYMKVMCFGKIKPSEENACKPSCHGCTNFVLEPETDIEHWWSELKKNHLSLNKEHGFETYVNVIKFLFYQMYLQEDCITESDVLRYTGKMTDEIGTLEKLFFWSDIQFTALKDNQRQRIALLSPFGTGKTTLLKAKARQVLEAGQKTIFIVFSESSNPLLKLHIEKEFQDTENIQVIQMACKGSNLENEILKLVQNNPDSNIFMDEVPFGDEAISTKFLNKIAQEMSPEQFLWVAFQSQKPPNARFLKEFFIPKLTLPLRYPGNLLKTCEAHRDQIGGASWPPKGLNPDSLLNQGNRNLFLSLKPETSFVFAVTQLAYILNKEVAQTIIKIESDEESIIAALKSSTLKDRLVLEENVEDMKEFLSSNEKILIITSKSDSSLKGFEVPMLVVFSNFLGGHLNDDIFSRCKSKLIVICDEDHAKKIIPSNKETDFAKIIEIFDSLMPETLEDAIRTDDYEKVYSCLTGRKKIPLEIRNEASQTGLIIACAHGAVDTTEALLEDDIGVVHTEDVDAIGWTALHHASSFGSLECIKLLRQKGADITATTNKRETSLHLAAEKGFTEVVDFLAKNGCPVDAKSNEHCDTAMTVSIQHKHLETFKCLVDNGADLKYKHKRGMSLLHIAVLCECYNIVEELLRMGFDIEERDGWDYTPLMIATDKCKNLKMVKFLVDKKANIQCVVHNFNRSTLLLIASSAGALDIVKYSIEDLGEDFHALSMSGESCLDLAVAEGHYETVQYLMEKMYCKLDSDQKEKYLTCLCHACKSGDIDLFKFIYKKFELPEIVEESNDQILEGEHHCLTKIDLGPMETDGKSMFHHACSSKNLDFVKFLEKHFILEIHEQDKLGFSALHWACFFGPLDIVKYLIEEKQLDWNVLDNLGESCLHEACFSGSLDIVKYLIDDKQADLNVLSNNGTSCLHQACKSENLDIVKYLIDEKNADLNILCKNGTSCLHQACEKGSLDIVKYLIEDKNADLNILCKNGTSCLHQACQSGSLVDVKDHYGKTVLYNACKGGNMTVSKYLIEEIEQDVNTVDNMGQTCLHFATRSGNLYLVKYIFEQYKQTPLRFDSKGQSALHVACANGEQDIVLYFVEENHFDIGIKDNNGKNCFHHACSNRNYDLVKYLVETKQMSINEKDHSGKTGLHLVCAEGHFQTAKILIQDLKKEKGINSEEDLSSKEVESVRSLIRVKDKKGKTCLHFACQFGNLDLVRLLIEEGGVTKQTKDFDGITEIHYACDSGHLDVVKFLHEEMKQDLNVKDQSGRNCFHHACTSRNLDIVKYVNDKIDESIHKQDHSGKTALHMASAEGSLDIVKYLIEEKAMDISMMDNHGKRCLHYASISGNTYLVKYLLKKLGFVGKDFESQLELLLVCSKRKIDFSFSFD